jgi:hypothetical protein
MHLWMVWCCLSNKNIWYFGSWECIWLGACSFAVLIDWWTNSAVNKRYRINQFTWIKFVVLCYKVVLLNCCCVNRFSLHILLCHNFCPVLPGPKHTPVLIKFSDQKRYFNLAQGSLSWTSLCVGQSLFVIPLVVHQIVSHL